MGSAFRQVKKFEFILFVLVLAVATIFLGGAMTQVHTDPPHAGVSIVDDGSEVTVTVITMGQSDTVQVVVNGTERASLTEVDQSFSINKDADVEQKLLIISNNSEQSLLLQEKSF